MYSYTDALTIMLSKLACANYQWYRIMHIMLIVPNIALKSLAVVGECVRGVIICKAL